MRALGLDLLFFPVYLCPSSMSLLKVEHAVGVNILPPNSLHSKSGKARADTRGINGHYHMPYRSENTGLLE